MMVAKKESLIEEMKTLDENTINKIAAGEVIENPANVCKRGGCSTGGSYIGKLSETLSKDYNLKTESTSKDQKVVEALGQNKMVIVLMGPGTFTTGGHYIVLAGVNNKKQVQVFDPASKNKTQKWFDFNKLHKNK